MKRTKTVAKIDKYMKQIFEAETARALLNIRTDFSLDTTLSWEQFMTVYEAYEFRKVELKQKENIE